MNYNCSRSYLLRQYILIFDDEVMGQFIDNPMLDSCAKKTNCRIYLTNRWLNRIIRPGCWERYFIVNVFGEDQFAVDRCNRLVERCIPAYKIRQRYKSKSNITLYTNEWIPDNSPVGETSMRMGAQRSNFGSLLVNSPFATTRGRPMYTTPWKISVKEKLGHYESRDIYRPIYCKAEYGPVEFINPRFPLPSELSRLNFANAFDRYTTLKAIDNENINLKLQQQSCRFFHNLKNKDGNRNIFFENDFRQSTTYNFENVSKVCDTYTVKIKSSDIRAATLYRLNNNEFRKTNFSILNNSTRNESVRKDEISKEIKITEEPESLKPDQGSSGKLFEKGSKSQNQRYSKSDERYQFSQSTLKIEDIREENVNQSNYVCPKSVEIYHRKKSDITVSNRNKNNKCKKKRNHTLLNLAFNRKNICHHCLKWKYKKSRFNRLMRLYLRRNSIVHSESNLTLITSPIITDSINTTNKASKSLNIDDNTLESLNSF